MQFNSQRLWRPSTGGTVAGPTSPWATLVHFLRLTLTTVVHFRAHVVKFSSEEVCSSAKMCECANKSLCASTWVGLTVYCAKLKSHSVVDCTLYQSAQIGMILYVLYQCASVPATQCQCAFASTWVDLIVYCPKPNSHCEVSV